jgi:NTE family protein
MRAATAIHSDQFNGLFSVPSIVGAQLGYSYHTFFGPIDLRLGYSNHTREAYFFINLGHRF